MMKIRYVYHITLKNEWEEASKTEFYDISTYKKRLDEVGFIHLSFKHQLKKVIKEVYKDLPSDELLILKISTTKLAKDKLKIEDVNNKKYPHYYGPIETRQIKKVSPAKARLRISPFPRTSRDAQRSRRVWHA